MLQRGEKVGRLATESPSPSASPVAVTPRRTSVSIHRFAPYDHSVSTDATIGEASEILTRREFEVMDRAAHGLTNARIADELHVTTHAIKFHLASVYRKLGVANRTEATAWYVAALARENREEGS
jgi:DNA-binding CsgD family transcriptional regulator